MKSWFRPNIAKTTFPFFVRGPGKVTPLVIHLSGWGFLRVKVKNNQYLPFKQWIPLRIQEIEIDVPKDEVIQIYFWNIFGLSKTTLLAPGNNTNINEIQESYPASITVSPAEIENFSVGYANANTSAQTNQPRFAIENRLFKNDVQLPSNQDIKSDLFKTPNLTDFRIDISIPKFTSEPPEVNNSKGTNHD